MAAIDYTFAEGMTEIYLTKKKKRRDGVMSEDRRSLTEQEQIYIVEHYLRRYCNEHKTDEVTITDSNQKPIFKMVLIDK